MDPVYRRVNKIIKSIFTSGRAKKTASENKFPPTVEIIKLPVFFRNDK
jgi:hypothetical protein